MDAATLVATLRGRGVELIAAGDRIRFRPPEAVPDALVDELRRLKPAVLALLRAQEQPPALPPALPSPGALRTLLGLPLVPDFAAQGQMIELRVPWWSETLFFVPAVHDAEVLCRQGVARHRVWTAGELIALLGASPLTTEALLTVMRARQAFDAEVVEVRPSKTA